MEQQINALHDLRREFHNMLGLMKIIHTEIHTQDNELKEMIQMSLEREEIVLKRFEELERNV